MSDYMPMEIVEQVLLRLPMKPLLRCLSICKKWYNLITSTDFISTHLHFTKSLPNSNRIFIQYRTPVTTGSWPFDNINYVIYSDDEAGNFEEHVRFPMNIFGNNTCGCCNEFICVVNDDICRNYWRLAGCCNGLICIANSNVSRNDPKEVILWNPAIRRSLDLPRSDTQFIPIQRKSHHVFGFVFDHIGNDYKVLRISRWDGDSDEILGIVEVFRLSTGLWEDISHKAPFQSIAQNSLQVDLKGIAHWIVDCNGEMKIITFDVHEEVFGSIELPFDVVNDGESHGGKYLFAFDESLFLIRDVTIFVYGQPTWKIDVWKMGDYNVVDSWNRVHTWVFDEVAKPLCFRKNGEILWWVMAEGKLISTNLKGAFVNYLGIRANAIYVTPCLYVESLILLDKSSSIEDDDEIVEMLQKW